MFVCGNVCVCIHIHIYMHTYTYIYINSTSCYMKVSNLCVDSCLITGLPFHQTRHQNFSCSSPRSTSREKFFLAMFVMSLIVNIFSSKMYLITDTVNTGTLSVLLWDTAVFYLSFKNDLWTFHFCHLNADRICCCLVTKSCLTLLWPHGL